VATGFDCACQDNDIWWDLNLSPEGCGGSGSWPTGKYSSSAPLPVTFASILTDCFAITDWYGFPVCHLEHEENSQMLMLDDDADPSTPDVETAGPYTTATCHGPDAVADLSCDMQCEYESFCTWEWWADNGGSYDDMACMGCRDACPPPVSRHLAIRRCL
jgi:hypothetical protein